MLRTKETAEADYTMGTGYSRMESQKVRKVSVYFVYILFVCIIVCPFLYLVVFVVCFVL